MGFDINYRELLSCAFAVHTWSRRWASQHRPADPPRHVPFKIDNTSAVAWHHRTASCNFRAQTIVWLLGFWEVELGLRFSAVHVAGAENRIADAGHRGTEGDMTFYLQPHFVAASAYSKYLAALRAWHPWTTRRGIQPTLLGYPQDVQLQLIFDFTIYGFQYGFGSGRPVRGCDASWHYSLLPGCGPQFSLHSSTN